MSQVEDRRKVATGGDKFQIATFPATGSSTAALADQYDVLYRESSDINDSLRSGRQSANMRDLDHRLSRIAKAKPLVEALADLYDHGFAWRDIARILGVSVPAVAKWRRGGGGTGENRLRAAKLLALIEMLEQRWVSEPVSWLEMRVREGVALTHLDLLAAGRYDLVIDLASAHTGDNMAEKVLSEFDPEWRSNLVDDVFETYVAEDGIVSIRPKAVG
ncbi:hypothetical protein [Rhodococcus rhodochrous]|uniref:hypothetical protein n=1 Tax=Rhodococcus rhodochrous TaxID=1829 RepID=UPI0009BEE0BC|nr:hypothetical protein [Rhodococcus rhodochrous]